MPMKYTKTSVVNRYSQLFPTLLCTTGVSSSIQSNYSSALTMKHPIYSLDGCEIPNRHYEAIQLTVSNSGCYTFISKSAVNIIEYIYIHSFDVSNPNSIWSAHYNGNEKSTQFNFTVQLQTAINYVLVVSTYLPNEIGDFSIMMSGASKINFSRMSK